jgi:hypothetical protein
MPPFSLFDGYYGAREMAGIDALAHTSHYMIIWGLFTVLDSEGAWSLEWGNIIITLLICELLDVCNVEHSVTFFSVQPCDLRYFGTPTFLFC